MAPGTEPGSSAEPEHQVAQRESHSLSDSVYQTLIKIPQSPSNPPPLLEHHTRTRNSPASTSNSAIPKSHDIFSLPSPLSRTYGIQNSIQLPRYARLCPASSLAR